MTPTPKISIDLGCTSAVEFAKLAPFVTHDRGIVAGFMRQLRKDYARDFALEVVPYPIDRARNELEQAAAALEDKMARHPAMGEKVRELLERADTTEDITVIATCIAELKSIGSNPFIR